MDQQQFNFNEPLELTELFRSFEEPKQARSHDEEDSDGVLPPGPIPERKIKEYAFKHAIGWEEIRGIKQYMYPDDWKLNKGEKYFLNLHGEPEDILVLGSYMKMLQHWRLFRNSYPIFKDEE